ncbi:MAG TPA: PilZ domain-containing protein [Spirochaetota bacterium]|mgnify:CR=1 FL=1|nr:PilZ domain-containing protein [Spirochaetota bacterium]HPJ37156.1 PilZ domain-containing protein [Spirochaetota bacterium]
MDQRKEQRLSPEDSIQSGYVISDFILELKTLPDITANVVDISLDGAGFSINDIDEDVAGTFTALETLFTVLHINDVEIFAESRLVWSNISRRENRCKIQGGIQFTVMAPEDRIALHNILMTIRNNTAG